MVQKRQIYNYVAKKETSKKCIQLNAGGSEKIKKKGPSNNQSESINLNTQQKSNTNKRDKRIRNIKQVEKDVLQCIIGQDKQVKEIITAIYRGIYFKSIKSNTLIIGDSGTGKTETIIQIAKRLHLPYTVEDATNYSKVGYYGDNVEDMIFNLIENADGNLERAQNGIIIIDEIDKKVSGNKNDVSGVEVLKSLLKMIEGTTIKVTKEEDTYYGEVVDFDTKNILIVFLGAFSGLEKIRDKRLNRQALGFASSNMKENTMKNDKFTKKDLMDYGMPKEFVGRIDTIIQMKTLTKQDLVTILRKSKLSIFRRYQNELRKRGITLDYDGKLFEKIAEEAMSAGTGARELSNVVNSMFTNIIYDVMAEERRYTKCKLSLDIVEDNTRYELL